MRRPLVIIVLGLFFALTQGCAATGISSPFGTDPLTGGADAATSRLLGVPVPGGMQFYADHSYQTMGAGGGQEGLETLRGAVSADAAAQSMHAGLQAQGWQLRSALRKGDRSVQVYERGAALAVLTFRPQVAVTVMEIWVGGRLPDGAALPALSAPPAGSGFSSPPASGGYGESFGGSGGSGGMNTTPAPRPGATEQWGGGLQERSL